jgi:hypothetical protein
MRKTSLFFAIAFAVCHSPGETRAADEATCRAYAIEATSPPVQDAMDNCGYSGDAWNPGNPKGHFDWCIRASAQAVSDERDRRGAAIRTCERCKGYAASAVNAYDFNDPEGRIRGAADGHAWPPMPCGFSGDAWSPDFKGHVRWCLGASEADARRETENRKAFTDICRTCREYAHKAVVAYHNVWDKCKSFWADASMSGEDWSIDHQHHVRWCLGLNAARRPVNLEFAGARRERIVKLCTAKVQAPLTIQTPSSAETIKRVPAKKEGKRAATKPVAAARQSANTAAVKSSPAKKQSTGSSSSAMDRLGGGGSSGGTGSSGAASAAKARSGSSAAAPASSGTGGGGGGVAPPATTINRNAIGGGGSPERIR